MLASEKMSIKRKLYWGLNEPEGSFGKMRPELEQAMKKSILGLGMAAALALAAYGAVSYGYWPFKGAVAQAPTQKNAPRVVPVEIATATKKRVPVRIELLGTVTPMASVAVKTRIDSEITEVHFRDGATVKQGELLFTMDNRAIEAQIRQAEGQLARDKAQLEGAMRDQRRYSDLVDKGATPVTNLDNAKTQVGIYTAAIKADEGMIENLKVQLTYTTIRAPITGRISMAAVKVGNFVRQADPIPLATLIQSAPVYVTFALPQRSLPDLRQALNNETAVIEALAPGDPRRAQGHVTMIENTVDPVTGTVPVRATMSNDDEMLWPGTLVTVQLNFRDEEAVVVPPSAVQVSQTGSFVFVVTNGVANVRPVKVARVIDAQAVIESGLEGGEQVVTVGHLQITEGSRVSARQSKAGS
jgi:membrane fusion protein, multidrug efflux system